MTPLTDQQTQAIRRYGGELSLFVHVVFLMKTGRTAPRLPRRVLVALNRLVHEETKARGSFKATEGEFHDLLDHCRFVRGNGEMPRPPVLAGIEAVEHYIAHHCHRYGHPHRPDDRMRQGEDPAAAHDYDCYDWMAKAREEVAAERTTAEPESKPAPTITARIEGVFSEVDAPGLRLRTMPHESGALVAFEPLPGTPPFLSGYVGPYLHVSHTASDAEIVGVLYRAAEAFALDRVRHDFKHRGTAVYRVRRGDDSPVRRPGGATPAAMKHVARGLGVPRAYFHLPAVMEFGGDYRIPAERDAESEASV